ncbi:pirin family protein [Caldimonas sp. KR1-144]|uniref:pirin family protein n=1 Tax=Caldimonas sp. KR1-144 TaxID=3400911 RepID=UPI003BFB7D0B
MALLQLKPHTKDLGGGFTVRRLLPAAAQRAVGPFVFFDHMGPVTAQPADNHDVRPHPHIGLATVTYLFEGAMMHRDSTGVVQRIEPGAINLMIGGRGVVHSERTPDDLRSVARTSHGLQLWLALPEADEEMAPEFHHVAADAIPQAAVNGVAVRVLIGEAFGRRSPVPQRSPTLYLEMALPAGASIVLPDAAEQRAVYAVDAPVTLDGETVEPQHLAVLAPGSTPTLAAPVGARVALVGGAPLGHRHMWWNFVSSRKERIEQAADDWAAGRFPKVPGDEIEFIPLPERRF